MKFRHFLAAAAVAATAVFTSAPTAKATTVDVDLMFVIDRSGSMGGEFTTLGARIGDVLSGLSGATNAGNGVTIGDVQAGLVSYLGTPRLEQTVTGDVSALQTAFGAVSASGSTENANGAVMSVIPGGSLFNSLGWRNDTVKSVILITDENSDINTDYAGTGAAVTGAGYFNNIITLQSLYSTYAPAAVPSTGLFDLDVFRNDASAFLIDFINTKVAELTTGGTTPGSTAVPLPAAGWMLIAALGGLGAMRRRKEKAA